MARSLSPKSTLIRTGAPSAVLEAAMPEGKAGEVIKVWPWGDNNLEPQQILRVLYDSGTATTCVERLGLFIGGKGFASEATGEAMANPRQTFNQLLAEAAATAAVGLGVAYILRFTYGGELGEIYVADVDCLRREKDGAGRFVLNLKLAENKMPTGHNQVYLPYDPLASQEEISEQVIEAAASEGGYWGHLLFSFTGRLGRKRYPTPTWWAAKEAVEADAEAPRYDLKQFRNGFFPDAMVTLIGRKYDDVPVENWKPAEGETQQDQPYTASPHLLAMQKTIKDLKGSRTEASVWANFAETKEDVPAVTFFNQGPNSKGLTDATARLEGRVYRRFGVPPVLCGVSEPGLLGSNQQIVNSIQLFGLVINPARELCVGPLRHLFPNLDFTVTPLDPVDYIDPAVAADMTPDERRATRGLPPQAEVEEPAPVPTPKPRPKAA
jgi:hypothetical protein